MENAEERAYRYIISEILTGAYRPGDFLLELDIAPKLQMSRTPVSRALSRLVLEGFLNKMPKKGCYIPIPTPKDAEHVFTARMVAEGEAAALAAKNATDEEISFLESERENDFIAFEKKDREMWATINEEFHLSVAKFCRNQYIEKWVKNMFWRSNVYIFYFDGFYKPTDVVVEHETPKQHVEIVRAIRERDPKEARKLMKQHVYTTYSKLLIS
ncbi:MAG TPA: GntR family transcriptional regulator [Synergistaceae bacterium]|nr:GntR family transcriptional regulator [Synergistaceae bacterium]HQA54205.1 GntR family transcriptional regulator [Synergistaceae bacterium]